ncbi:MAG: hypothetical protein M3439_11235, partial [Chloroflexota bacterium]|nr:hypothetical protein [Chloroflexota bacterium]
FASAGSQERSQGGSPNTGHTESKDVAPAHEMLRHKLGHRSFESGHILLLPPAKHLPVWIVALDLPLI